MTNSPRDAVIISACRTPIGRIRGALSSWRADDLLAATLREAASRSGVPDALFDEVFAGCANQAGEDNRNVARMSALLAGFPDQLPGVTVNRLCASGLEAVIQGARSIQVGDNQLVLAGGVESMSRAPWVVGKPSSAYPTGVPETYDTSLGWRFPNKALAKRFELESMGQTAENVAKIYSISRQDQDDFALRSHQKAVKAQKEGLFDSEILRLSYAHNPTETRIIALDEGPRSDTNLEKLASLAPVFSKTGCVTAGNSSSLSDGASALAISSREFAKNHGLATLATIRRCAAIGLPPNIMGVGPVNATRKLLARLGLSISDIDVFEINEAFAAQSVAVIRELEIDEERVNIFGGALALGHPLGCSGARIVTTLLNSLKHKDAQLGVATLCVGVGQGVSLIIERE